MKKNRLLAREWGEWIVLALLFIAIGSLIMIVFSPWGQPLLGRVADYLGRIGLIILLLAATLLVRRSKRFEKYWQILFAFFVMTFAVSLDRIFGIYLIDYLGIIDNTPAGWALPKLNECAVIVSVIILFTRMSGSNLGSIYLQKGNLKLGLSIGLIAFFIAAAGSIPMATLFNARDLSLARILPWIPWLLIFVLANAIMEELLFRGLFLRKLEPFFGQIISNFMIALVFTFIHGVANYTADQYLFLVILFPLALAWGYIMQKTDSVWGSVLFHAGMDIPIMLGIFSNLS
ncbi:MAG: CPBP family intramembrane metalloprotease [Chloroflexi bacterium]|nr:CPBP family intramembrane metalloprotease [Chloroflexota bacterium]MBU1748363.1 CPBP family intramembrane metalloprotease [Chloroflexota bacterium]